MQLYAGSSQQFIDDTFHNRIAEKLRANFFNTMGYEVSSAEVRSWQNSLHHMSSVLQYAGLREQGILLEYQLPTTSKRLDCLVTGRDATKDASAVIVELKQWDTTAPSNIEDCVVTYVGGRLRDQLHPSRQAGQYCQYLLDTHTAFAENQIGLTACAYLHNLQFKPDDELFNDRHRQVLNAYPLFAGDQAPDLAQYLSDHVSYGEGLDVLGAIEGGKYRASKKLLEHTAAMIEGQNEYVLLDEQLVVFNAVMDQARKGFRERNKVVILVHGGPGTGKSVIALNLVGRLAKEGYNAQHATGSRAFTENLRRIVKSRAGVQFRYFNSFMDAEPNAIDVLIMDEAHRIREASHNRFTPKSKRTGLPQIIELMNAAKVAVFFIDDRQIVRPGEVGSSELVREAAVQMGSTLLEFDLEAQFRLGGSETFLNWVENTLAIRKTPNVLWDGSENFEFKIVDSVDDLEHEIRSKQREGFSARLTAGFCWPWSDPEPDGTLVPDVQLDGWRMPWNAKPDSGRLAPGIPKSNFWASDPAGIEQVGCVYTAQGFEFDYIGVIWGRDLSYDPRTGKWVADPSQSHDSVVKRSSERFLELVKNTYRVLLTRGLKGCYVYFMDEDTRNFFRSRMG